MSVVAIRPWTSHEDIILQRLAAAGKYVATIAAEMNRSEAAIRSHANPLESHAGQRETRFESEGESKMTPVVLPRGRGRQPMMTDCGRWRLPGQIRKRSVWS